MALGLTIVYGVTHIFNFGHGIVAVSGGYFTWLCMSHFGLGLFPAIAVSVAVSEHRARDRFHDPDQGPARPDLIPSGQNRREH